MVPILHLKGLGGIKLLAQGHWERGSKARIQVQVALSSGEAAFFLAEYERKSILDTGNHLPGTGEVIDKGRKCSLQAEGAGIIMLRIVESVLSSR